MRIYSPADGADHAEEYSKLYYFAEKDRLMFVLFLEFLCDYLGDLRETHGVLFGDWLSKLACLSPADYADYADEYSKLHYFAEKDCLELVWFWVRLRKSARSAGDIEVLSLVIA